MPEMKDSKYCPVTSYLIYIMSLNRASDKMWQQARFCHFPADPKERIYYSPGNLGVNPIETFISVLAKKAGLEDDKYTNYCLHDTGVNILSPYFTNKQIQSVTGHTCNNSLQIYQ